MLTGLLYRVKESKDSCQAQYDRVYGCFQQNLNKDDASGDQSGACTGLLEDFAKCKKQWGCCCLSDDDLSGAIFFGIISRWNNRGLKFARSNQDAINTTIRNKRYCSAHYLSSFKTLKSKSLLSLHFSSMLFCHYQNSLITLSICKLKGFWGFGVD